MEWNTAKCRPYRNNNGVNAVDKSFPPSKKKRGKKTVKKKEEVRSNQIKNRFSERLIQFGALLRVGRPGEKLLAAVSPVFFMLLFFFHLLILVVFVAIIECIRCPSVLDWLNDWSFSYLLLNGWLPKLFLPHSHQIAVISQSFVWIRSK